MNLSAIVGSINSAEKYDMFIQNFTIGVGLIGGGRGGSRAGCVARGSRCAGAASSGWQWRLQQQRPHEQRAEPWRRQQRRPAVLLLPRLRGLTPSLPHPQPQRYFTPLAPGAEASLEYKFRADPILGSTPAREFQVALHLLYEVDGQYYSSTFFNQTVDISEAPRLVDADLIWLAVTLIALAGGAGGWQRVGWGLSGGGRGAGREARPSQGPFWKTGGPA
jgi:hypothetical protein